MIIRNKETGERFRILAADEKKGVLLKSIDKHRFVRGDMSDCRNYEEVEEERRE